MSFWTPPRRDHERQRLLQEREQYEAERERKFWHNLVVIKVTVFVSFVAYMVVPVEYKDWVVLCGNTLWLLKT